MKSILSGLSPLLFLSSLSFSTITQAVARQFNEMPTGTMLRLLESMAAENFAGTMPQILPLSSLDEDYSGCVETNTLGTVCSSGGALYVDDTLLLEGKEYSTGIGFIDNNSKLLEEAVGSGALAGPLGSLVGAFWGDKAQTEAKISELRQQNFMLQADNAQSKVDRVNDAERFKTERQAFVDSNDCLRANDSIHQFATVALTGYFGEFRQCLTDIDASDAGGSTRAQSCLDTYVNKAEAGLNAAKVFGNCK